MNNPLTTTKQTLSNTIKKSLAASLVIGFIAQLFITANVHAQANPASLPTIKTYNASSPAEIPNSQFNEPRVETFTLDKAAQVFFQYTVADPTPTSGHCSSIRLHVSVDDNKVYTTPFMGWKPALHMPSNAPGSQGDLSRPLTTGFQSLGHFSAGTHTISTQQEGTVGGCNTGRLSGGSGPIVLKAAFETNNTPTPTPTATPKPTDRPNDADKGIRITKNPDRSITRPGHTFNYQITVENTGDVDFHDLTISDHMPNVLDIISISNGGHKNGNTVTWENLTLNAGEKKIVSIEVRVKSNAADQTIINEVIVRDDDHGVEDRDRDNDIRVSRATGQIAAISKTHRPAAPQAVPVSANTGVGLGLISAIALAGGSFGALRIKKYF